MNRHVLFACLLLAACGDSGTEPPSDSVSADPTTPQSPAEPPADNGTEPPAEDGGNGQDEAPQPAPIPAAFRGIWAESQALCDDRSHPSRLVLSGTSLRFYESAVTVADVELIGPREINIVGTAEGEGTRRPAEYHFSIDAAGNVLTDEAGGGMVRQRCGA